MADLLLTSGANRVLTIDLHSPQIQGFFSNPADQLTAVPAICDRLAQDDISNTVVVAADVGEAKDAGRFAQRLHLPLAFIDKRRTGDDENARAAHIIGDIVGKDCLLVDDEIATGGTIFSATEFLLERGARSVSAAIIHAGAVRQGSRAPGGLAPDPPAGDEHDPHPARKALGENRGVIARATDCDGHHPHSRRPLGIRVVQLSMCQIASRSSQKEAREPTPEVIASHWRCVSSRNWPRWPRWALWLMSVTRLS